MIIATPKVSVVLIIIHIHAFLVYCAHTYIQLIMILHITLYRYVSLTISKNNMPPSSRKRNKGKERKAKQQAKKEENDRADANRFWRSYRVTITGCNHGCDIIPADDHPVISFMDQFFINTNHKSMNVKENMREIFKSHPQIWNNEGYRKLVLAILVRIGTNMLLSVGSPLTWPLCLAESIVALGACNLETDMYLLNYYYLKHPQQFLD